MPYFEHDIENYERQDLCSKRKKLKYSMLWQVHALFWLCPPPPFASAANVIMIIIMISLTRVNPSAKLLLTCALIHKYQQNLNI